MICCAPRSFRVSSVASGEGWNEAGFRISIFEFRIFTVESALEILFESVAKIRILRLFLQNADRMFSFPEIIVRTQVKKPAAAREIAKLIKAALIKQKMGRLPDEGESNSGATKKKHALAQKKVKLYQLQIGFPLLQELGDLVLKSAATDRKLILQRIKRLGRVKLAIISGIFINNDNTRTDLFIVGDDIKQKTLDKFLQQIESELGKPIQYTVMELDEYKYRMNMYDRFLRDILDKPHEKLINKLQA